MTNAHGVNGGIRSDQVADEVITQVGRAAAEILKLRQSMEEDLARSGSEDERQALAHQIESAAVRAIDDQGLTVEEYNRVVTAAQADKDLEERLLVACRAA